MKVLNVVSKLVGEHVRLRKIAAGSEALLQLVEESEVEIDPFIDRAVEWPHHRLSGAAAGIRRVPEQHQFRRMKGRPGSGEDFRPRVLDIVQHEGNELNLGLLGR